MEKIENVKIINNKNNIKEYNNLNLDFETILKNLGKNLKDKQVKKIENIYFKYKKQYKNFDEKILKENEIREIFLQELEKELENIQEEEKELILKQTKKSIEKNKYLNEELDYTNLINLLFLQIPLLFLDKTKNTLIILNNNIIKEVKERTIQKVKENLNIELNEIQENEYLQLKNELIGKNVNEIIENIDNKSNKKIKINNENLIEKYEKRIQKLEQENNELKKLSNEILKESKELKQNYILLQEFIRKDIFVVINEIMKIDNLDKKQKLRKELELKLSYNPNFTQTLSM